MKLLKTSFLSGISTLIKILSGFIVNKLVAVYIGPSGLAMIGQFQNLIQIILTFANGAIDKGVVKYIAEYQEQPDQRRKVISNSFLISVVCAFVMSAILFIFNKEFSIYFLKDIQYSSVFVIFAFTIILFALNSLFLAILNGYKEIKKFIIVNIVSSIVTLIFVSLLVVYLKLYGALLALATSQAVVFFFTIFFVVKSSWFDIKNFFAKVDKVIMLKLGKYSLMALTTALTIPLAQIIVRDFITTTISADAAGFWQGVYKISDVYLMVITTSLSIYYLPRLSEIKDNNELRKEILQTYKIVMPIVTVLAVAIWIFKGFIIQVLFTEEFMPMKSLFMYQLIGDVFKVGAWLLAFIMVAKAMTRYYIAMEIIFSIIYVISSIAFINNYGLIGSTMSFAFTYMLSFFALIYIFRKIILLPKNTA